ncbi:hypothetical protein B566_EDAN004523 [Ephemera danica]|nr:hypothetical protein B566_EDAN004523 [Ephemera danica]
MMPTCPAAYWHISCGPSYWLFGRVDGRQAPEPEKYRGVLSPDVTTMCLRRRLVVCARKSPDQILVYQMPRNLPHDKETLTCALQCPILILPTSEPTVMLEVTFQGPQVLIFATGPSSSMHCYVLTRDGHGTTPSPTPSPEPSQEELDLLNLPNIDHNLAYPVAND